MIYCDASLLVAVLTPERHSGEARRWFVAQGEANFVISNWVDAEIASALAMKVRRGVLTQQERVLVWSEWEDVLATRIPSSEVQVEDFRRAARLVDAGPGLRAGNALHLAIAVRLRCAVATLDHDLAEAARALGLGAPTILATP